MKELFWANGNDAYTKALIENERQQIETLLTRINTTQDATEIAILQAEIEKIKRNVENKVKEQLKNLH